MRAAGIVLAPDMPAGIRDGARRVTAELCAISGAERGTVAAEARSAGSAEPCTWTPLLLVEMRFTILRNVGLL
jgi:hypothetical protein